MVCLRTANEALNLCRAWLVQSVGCVSQRRAQAKKRAWDVACAENDRAEPTAGAVLEQPCQSTADRQRLRGCQGWEHAEQPKSWDGV